MQKSLDTVFLFLNIDYQLRFGTCCITEKEISSASQQIKYVEINRQLDATEDFITDLIDCSTCFGHQYAHNQELKNIMQWLFPVVFRAVVFKLLVWCGAEGYVSGLQDAAASCKPDT